MNCYYCQTELKLDGSHNVLADKYKFNSFCENCYKLHDVKVYTTNGHIHHHLPDSYELVDDGELLFTHIYVDETKFNAVLYGKPAIISVNSQLAFGHNYHIRVHHRENFTQISDSSEHDTPIFKVPGFPINPANAKYKLKLYLLFS